MDRTIQVVLLPILAGSFVLAVMQIVQRGALNSKGSPTLYLCVSYGVATVIGVVVYLGMWGATLPQHLEEGYWKVVFIALGINIGLLYLNAKALTYKQGEASLVSPLAAMTPGLIVLLAATLGEVPGPLGVAGVALMAGGSWVLMFKERPAHWWGYLMPFQRLLLLARYSSLTPDEKERAIVVAMAFGSACMSTFGLLAVGLYVRRAGDMQGIWMAIVIVWVLLSVIYGVWTLLVGPSRALHEWRGEGKKFSLATIGYAVLIAVGSWLEVPPFAETYIGYVGTLNRSRILFVVLLGHFVFNEADIRKRLFAAVAISIGAALITIEGTPARLIHTIVFLNF